MHLNRLLIPKNFLFYLLFLAVAFAYMALVLWGYYHLGEVERFFEGVPLPFLDLQESGNLLDWFFSILWIHIGIISMIILSGTIDRQESWVQVLFWINVPVVAVVMSAETVCSLSTFVTQLVERDPLSQGEFFSSFAILRFIFLFFVLTEFWLLFHYIRTRTNTRLILTFCGLACFMSLLGVFLFCSSVPMDGALSRKENRESNPITGSEKSPIPISRGTHEKETEDLKKKTKSEKEKAEPARKAPKPISPGSPKGEESPQGEENPFRFAGSESSQTDPATDQGDREVAASDSKEKSSSSLPVVDRWEDIFGWEKSFEENWQLSGKLEDYLGIQSTIEAELWGANSPEVAKIRESIHYGGMGIFLLLLSLTVQLLARAGRVAVEKKILKQFGDLAAVCELTRKR